MFVLCPPPNVFHVSQVFAYDELSKAPMSLGNPRLIWVLEQFGESADP